MSIDMYLGSSDQQASSTQHVLQNHINAYQQLQTALSQFTVNSPSLSGVTYQSAKAYSSQVLTPLLRASILLDEAIIAACRKLPSEYRSSVDSVDLRESDLVDRIARADRIVGRYQELINIEYQRTKPNWSRIQNLQTARSNQLTVKRKLEEKLHKLRAFHQSSPQIFSQIAGLHSAVQQGIRQSQQSWNASTKTFVLPPKSEMKWAEEVNGKWEESPTYMQELIHKSQKGFELSDKECEALGQYLLDNPNSKLYKNGVRALQKEIDGKLKDGNKDVSEFLLSLAGIFGSEYLGESVEDAISQYGKKLGLETAGEIFNNRYSITMISGAILGKTPGATRLYTEFAEKSIGATFKGLGKVASFSSGLLVGVGMNMFMGDSAAEAWGKEISVGLTTVGITGGVYLGSAVLAGVGLISAPVTLSIGAVVGIGVGVSLLNDWAREKWPDLKKFQDNIGSAVVGTWNGAVDFVSDGFSILNPFD